LNSEIKALHKVKTFLRPEKLNAFSLKPLKNIAQKLALKEEK